MPATESAFDLFTDDSKGHGYRNKRNDRAASTSENLYHDAIIIRLNAYTEGGDSADDKDGGPGNSDDETNFSERCVWVVTVAPQHQAHSGVDIFTDEIPVRRLAVDQFGAHPLVLTGGNDYHGEKLHPGDICAVAVDFWFPILDHTAQLVMTALLHHFETKRINTQVLQSEAVAEFSNLLNNASSAESADLVLEEAGTTSYLSSNAHLLETMSQRSEEDDVLQSHVLLDDAYWDKVWQSLPSALDGFLTARIPGLGVKPKGSSSVSAFDEEDQTNRVQRTCKCEIYLASSTLITEIGNASTATAGAETGYQYATGTTNNGVFSDMPIINSKRMVSMLKLRESDSIDGHADALNTVLRSAILKDTAAVQSYSEVSFQEKAQSSASSGTSSTAAGGAKGNKSTASTSSGRPAVEKGPHVEFHTVIAVPLLRADQQDAVHLHMTTSQSSEMGSIKGCILVHVTSVLLENSNTTAAQDNPRSALLAARAHPTYAASFTSNSTNTHSAYMEQIAGSYNLLESGRQPLVMAVVDIMDVLGGMMLTFLISHNCRPINLLPMAHPGTGGQAGGGTYPAGGADKDGDGPRGSESAVALSALMSSASTSYADASRWNNCITDGLFSLMLPPSLAPTSGTPSHSGVAPSLESLAYVEESKSKEGFRPLSQDHLLRHNAMMSETSHAALVYHLCTLFHSDWVLIFTSDPSATVGGGGGGRHSSGDDRSAHWAPRISSTNAEEFTEYAGLRVIDNAGVMRNIPSTELPSVCRSIVVQNLATGNVQASSSLRHGGHSHHHSHRHAPPATHEFVKEIPGVKAIPVAELLSLLHVTPQMKQSIHQVCDSSAALHLHHTVAICLDPHSGIGMGAFGPHTNHKKKSGANIHVDDILPPTSNIVILTGRFMRGPFYTPFPSTPSVGQLNLLFQSAIARRDLLVSKETVSRLLNEKAQSQHEVAYTTALEGQLAKLHDSTLGGMASNIASLVAFRKGLLGVLIDFFSELHKLHFASYTNSGNSDTKGVALEVIGIELVVDESTGLEAGRHRKWALSASTADWVRVTPVQEQEEHSHQTKATSAFQRAARKKVIQAPQQQQTLHSQLNVPDLSPPTATMTAEVLVDVLGGVYEEKGTSMLHIHRTPRKEKERKKSSRNSRKAAESDDESDYEDADVQHRIGMTAAIHVHYEFPVASISRHSGGGGGGHFEGRFFTALQSSPMWMRILRHFIGTNSQALFQPLYPIYTPLKLQHNPYQQVSIDEEQQWEDDALYAQASNIAINALSTTIVHDSTCHLNRSSFQEDGDHEVEEQHPHYRYLHQRKLLRQLTVVPPFSAFMLIPIRELTSSEVSTFDDDSSSDSSVGSAQLEVENVRYVHLLPPVGHHEHGHHHHHHHNHDRKKSSSPLARSVLPSRLNESIRTAVHSARYDHLNADDYAATAIDPLITGVANASANNSSRKRKHSAPAANHHVRSSRLTVLDGGIGSVLHNYLSEMHDKQQRRRAHNPMSAASSHEYDLYGYVDIGTHSSTSAGDKSNRGHPQEIALVDPHSLVMLYTPLLHEPKVKKSSAVVGLSAFEEDPDADSDQGLLSGDSNTALDHYYLVVCRQDRMIVPSSLVRLQTCLDELFLPSRVLAASQPWFECMSGIEQLVRAATVNSKAEFKPDSIEHHDYQGPAPARYEQSHSHSLINGRPDIHVDVAAPELNLSFAAPVISMEGQCQRILAETISIVKRIMGDRCLGVVGYQLRVNQNDLPDLLANAHDLHGAPHLAPDAYRAGREIELIRCCSDSGLVSSKNGKVMAMLQGPAKLQCPATVDQILNRFAPNDMRNHRNTATAAGVLGGSPARSGAHRSQHLHSDRSADTSGSSLSIHYVEMSSFEHIKQLQHSATSSNVINTASSPRNDGSSTPRTKRATNVTAVQEVLNAAHAFLHADVRVFQIIITSCPTELLKAGDGPQNLPMLEHVVASVLVYVSMNLEVAAGSGFDAEGKPEYEHPALSYIRREEITQNVVESLGVSAAYRAQQHMAPPVKSLHVSSLSKGILSCIMRVGDTAGALVSSLYRQQYDSYLQAYNTRTHRSQMQLHAQRLANTLLQIDHELMSIVGEDRARQVPDASPPGKPKKSSTTTSRGHSHQRFDTSSKGSADLDDPEQVMAQFLNDADQQREAAERALETAQSIIQQFYSLRQLFNQEQQTVTEFRSKYKASLDECRTKASQFRSFFEAIQMATAILPLPDKEDDVNSLHSGLDKIADNNAAVPDSVALQVALASTACNTQTLRRALEMLAELAVHEEFAQFFGSLLSSLSLCASDSEGSEIQSQMLSGDEDGDSVVGTYDRILDVVRATPFTRAKELAQATETVVPDMSATVWWVLEPGSHINAINLANAVQTVGNSLDINTLHCKEKFLEALNTKAPVLVEGEELLQKLPHVLAFFSANGHGGFSAGGFPTIRLLYQPVLATLPSEDDAADDISYSSADESNTFVTPGETVVVAVVQYVLSGASVSTSTGGGADAGSVAASSFALPGPIMHDDGSTIGAGSAGGGAGGKADGANSLSAVVRQVGRERVEQAIAYMGQHITLQCKVASVLPSLAPSQMSRSSRAVQNTLTAAMNQYVPRLLHENNLIGGVQWNAMIAALRFVMDPTIAPPPAPATSPPAAPSSKDSHHSSGSASRSKSGGSVSPRKRTGSGGSVRSRSNSTRASSNSVHKSHNAEKIAASAVFSPMSVWVGKLLVTLMRADAASMLHVTGSVKPPPKSKTTSAASGPASSAASDTSDGAGSSAAERYSSVVYEGVLYKYGNGTVTGGSPTDDKSSLNILHIRPSSWVPLQTLIEKYQAFFRASISGSSVLMQNTSVDNVFVAYQESVLSYTRKSSSGAAYSSRSVASMSGASATMEGSGSGKMRYILAGAINTSSVHTGSSTSGATAVAKKNVHFYDTEEEPATRVALKENDDFLVVELTRRPTSSDIKAFSSITQIVQAYIWGQHQRNTIKQKDGELSSISSALASSSLRLVEEQQENQQHRQYAELMQELHKQQHLSLAERSAASVSSFGSIGDEAHSITSEFSPRISDIIRGVHRTQDMLCEIFGEADSVLLLSAPRMLCNEVRNLLKSDTMSVISRGSNNYDDDLMGTRIDTVTRNFSKRALGRMLAAELGPGGGGGGGSVNAGQQYQAAAETQYQLATRKFAALAVLLNTVLVCDVGEVIAEEAMNMNINLSKTGVPAIARSILVPIIDHSPEPVVIASAPRVHELDESGVDFPVEESDLTAVSKLPWLDHAVQSAVAHVLAPSVGGARTPENFPMGGYYQQYHFDPRLKKAHPNPALTSTTQNSAHAWAMQLIFPTLEARDLYVTMLLGGTIAHNSNVQSVSSAMSSPSSTPGSSPAKEQHSTAAPPLKGSALPLTFLTGVSQYLKNSFVHSRNFVKEDVSMLQAQFENVITERVSVCMDQILLMSTPASNTANAGEVGYADKSDPIDFKIDEIAAALTHVFHLYKGKFNLPGRTSHPSDLESDGDISDEEELEGEKEAPPVPTSATFECSLSDAHLHWVNLAAPALDKAKGPSVRFHDSAAGTANSTDYKVGTWLTVALNEPAVDKSKPTKVEAKADSNTKQSSGVPTSSSRKQPVAAPQRGKVLHVEVAEEVNSAPPVGYKVEKDNALYQRCKNRQWLTQRTALTAQQIQAVKESPEGFMLYAISASKPLVHKPRASRSQSPAQTHGGPGHAVYSSTKQRPGSMSVPMGGMPGGHYVHQQQQQQQQDEQNTKGVAVYLNADGTVELQLLILVAGSEQPAILELRLRCNLTSGECCPAQLGRFLGRRRSKKANPVQIDELALAEMLEQITCVVLQPALPMFRLVRSSVAHLLEHCVAARGLVQWEAEWEVYLQHAQQRISLLSSCLTLLTSEGHKATGLLQQVQEALCRLSALRASTLICRDTVTNQVIYNRTMDYTNNQANDVNSAAAPDNGGKGGDSSKFNLQTPTSQSAFSFSDGAFSEAPSPSMHHPHRVSYMDLSRSSGQRDHGLNSSQPLVPSTPMSHRHSEDGTTFSLKDQMGHIESVNPALDNLEQLELVFECYEVQGSLTVYFAPEESGGRTVEDGAVAAAAAADNPKDDFSFRGSPIKRMPTSPYEPMRSPSAHRRAREQQRRTVNTSTGFDSQLSSPVPSVGQGQSSSKLGNGEDDESRRDLVSLNNLLETITRATARRVFELHRGSKNKKMMATKQHELSKRT